MSQDGNLRRRTTQAAYSRVDTDDRDGDSDSDARKSAFAATPLTTAAPKSSNGDMIVLAVLTLASFLTRFYRIGWSDKVVWDEAHFGKFGSHYIKRDFYFDVHPPLGKMLIGLSGVLARYDGSFDFKSGGAYPPEVNYTAMRMFCALWGALMVPLAYMTAKELRMTRWGCFAAGLMVLLDNAYVVISRFILLDSLLLFCTVLSFYCMTKFHNQQSRYDLFGTSVYNPFAEPCTSPFSADWWLWLFNTGVALGLVSSVKWVGFFAVALVGVYTLENLWDLLGDLRVSKATYIKHWIARAICLIVVPVVIYIISFKLHFMILVKSGPGDAQMSSLFQANLIGNSLKEGPLELAYGSRFTLKNTGYGGGLLHSHVQTYPHGSKQQQVTCYHHKDSNNDWIIRKTWENESADEKREEQELANAQNGTDDQVVASKRDAKSVDFVRNGDVVRLVHAGTGRNLHSHPLAGPITKTMNEVSCYGNATIGDANDYWIVEIVDDLLYGKKVDSIKKLSTRVRFRHKLSGCLLRSHNVNLPPWGFKQAEVVCDKRAGNKKDRDVYNMWNMENHWNDRLPQADPGKLVSKFSQDFVHLNVAMMTSNNALVPDPDKEPDGLTSSPAEWPLMQVGIRMCSWGDSDIKYYMFGNPIVWWLAVGSLAMYALSMFVYLVRFQRKYKNWTPEQWSHFKYIGKTLVVGWVFHYLPFGIMGRVTYLHHYFPALYFTVLLAAYMFDHLTYNYLHRFVRHTAWLALCAVVTGVFFYFSPLTFGLDTPSAEFGKNKKWLSTWKFSD
ncbi:Protein O-mannosyltransferase 2 [Sorochytrium milnesiophthora]